MSNLKKSLIIISVLGFLFMAWNTRSIKSDKTVVKFASWGSQSEVSILKPILDEFEKENPDIRVEFIHIPQNYFQKIHLLFASNLAPDVLFINDLYLPIYANAGVLEVLPSNYSSTFYAKALESLTYDDNLYAIPRDVSNMVIFYNKDIFNKYNVPLPNRYWSFDDLLILAQKLTKDTDNDGKTDVWGISFEESPALFYLPYLMSEGGGILSDDLSDIIISEPESIKGLQFYTDLRNKYHVAPTQAEAGSATMAQLFLQGKLAMQLSGRWLVPKYSEEMKFNWNVINFPSGDKGSVVPMDASGWAMAKSSKHKKEAMRLIDFLASQKSIETFTKSGLIVPARIDVAEGEFLHNENLKNSPINENVFIDAIKNSKKTPATTNYGEIQNNLKEKTNYLFNSNLTAKEVFNQYK